MLRWFAEEGWVAVLAVLTLVLSVLTELKTYWHEQRIRSIEVRFQGILERITAAYQKIDTVDRRVTGKFDVGNEDPTKLKKALKKIKNPQDFDDT